MNATRRDDRPSAYRPIWIAASPGGAAAHPISRFTQSRNPSSLFRGKGRADSAHGGPSGTPTRASYYALEALSRFGYHSWVQVSPLNCHRSSWTNLKGTGEVYERGRGR